MAGSALLRRVVTAAALLPAVVMGVLWLPTEWFAAGTLLFVLAGAWEWTVLVGLRHRTTYVGSTLLVVGMTLLALADAHWQALLLCAGVLWWLVALAWVVRYQQGFDPEVMRNPWLAAAVGWLVLVPCWFALVLLHSGANGPYLVMFLFVLIWSADTGAYFAGRLFGRRRLASQVSPGKTLEGLAGATLAVVVVTMVTADETRAMGLVAPFVVALVVMLVSVLGDLTESLFKRRAGLKDSGTLLPGHGGVLDRIDSLTAAAPVFVAMLAFGGGLG